MQDKPHHTSEGRFRNAWPGAPPPGHGGLLNWLAAHRGALPFPKDPDPSVFEVVAPAFPERRPDGEIGITWIGHATFLVQLGGANILTDPLWGRRVPPVPLIAPRRRVPAPFRIERLPPIDHVVISHNHYDHLESRTVRHLAAANPDTHWIVPLGVGRFLERRGARRVHELDWFESREVGGVTFTGTPAQHFSARGVFDRFRSLWCGWAVRRKGRCVYFAGDTAYFPLFPRIGAELGPFDVALLPIGSYEPRPFMQYYHMNPDDAVQAFQDLYSRVADAVRPVMIPMHWGTYKLTIEAMDEPPRRLRSAWRDAGLPDDRLRILRHGEQTVL